MDVVASAEGAGVATTLGPEVACVAWARARYAEGVAVAFTACEALTRVICARGVAVAIIFGPETA